MCSIAFPNSPGRRGEVTSIISGFCGNGCEIFHFFDSLEYNSSVEIFRVLQRMKFFGEVWTIFSKFAKSSLSGIRA